MTVYRDSIDAFMQVISGNIVLEEKRLKNENVRGREVGKGIPELGLVTCNVVDITIKRDVLENGIQYCIVQLVCRDGVHYSVQAYGKEAEELYNEAAKQLLLIHR